VLALRWDRRHPVRKTAEAAVFALLCRRAARMASAAGVQIADRVYGHHQTGAVDEGYLLHVVRTLPPGVSELYCHPGAAAGHDDELGAVTSPRVAAAIAAAGVIRRHYDEQDRPARAQR